MLYILLVVFLGAHVLGVFLIANLLLSRKRTTSMILWTLWLLLFPMLGIPLYLLLGTDRISRKRSLLHSNYPRRDFDRDAHKELSPLYKFAASLQSNALAKMKDPQILPNADNYYNKLIEAIDGAEQYIHFQTYVWRPDDVGTRFQDALIRAAKRGVKVRLLVDELGSPEAKDEFFVPLIAAGGEFSWCLTVHPKRNRFFFNLRNHRKLQLIDSKIAFIGGMNIGREYEGRNKDVGPWEDMHICFSGSIINDLQLTFIDDWDFATGKKIDDPMYFYNEEDTGDIPVALLRSGPDSFEQAFLKTFIFYCNHAEKKLDLFTPYFAPDDAMLMAIEMAALRGVKVRIMIPTLNEHKYMVDIGRSFYESLLEAGAEIYELPDAVNHAKVYLADDDWVMIGSPNLDIRSIRLNFEMGMLFRDAETRLALDEHYKGLFARCTRIHLGEYKQRPMGEKLKQGYVRLFAPLL